MINSRFGFVRFEFVCWIRSCILFIVHDADGGMGWFAPVGVKSRYLLAFCYLSIALALLYYFGTVVSAYFTGTCEGARACTVPPQNQYRTFPVLYWYRYSSHRYLSFAHRSTGGIGEENFPCMILTRTCPFRCVGQSRSSIG